MNGRDNKFRNQKCLNQRKIQAGKKLPRRNHFISQEDHFKARQKLYKLKTVFKKMCIEI